MNGSQRCNWTPAIGDLDHLTGMGASHDRGSILLQGTKANGSHVRQ